MDETLHPEKAEGALRLAVGVATVGRPGVVLEMLTRLQNQLRPADTVVVCSPKEEDVAGVAERFPDVVCLPGPRGLPHQRNVILEHLRGYDAVVYFDDDYVPCPDFLDRTEAVLQAHPDVVVATGHVLADGILGPGLSFEDADRVVRENPEAPPGAGEELSDVYNAYGCNMVIRLQPIHEHNIRFDENLPLYAWQEDADLSRQLAQYGRVVRVDSCRGVHLGVKSGRQSGVRLGYSQIANPVYLSRKGTMIWRRSLYLMSRNFAANVVKSFHAEPWVDRRGRLLGNLRAIGDLLTGRLDPGRVLTM